MTQHVETITFRTKQRRAESRRKRRQEGVRARHPARVAHRLAQARDLSDRLDAGGYADIARQHGLTRARITQIMNLLLVAPDIQAEVLDFRFPPGLEPVNGRRLRQVLASPVWREQREAWGDVRPTG